MNGYKIGGIVKTLAGHDKDQLFVIIDKQGEYVYLVDGRVRTLQKPKKKKEKHIQFVDQLDSSYIKSIMEQSILDAHIKKILKQY